MRLGRHRLIAWSAAAVVLTSLGHVAYSSYRHALAHLDQWMLRHAWQRMQNDAAATRNALLGGVVPVARLQVARLGVDVILSESADYSASRPRLVGGTALPGALGNAVFSGDRRTHFRFLQHLEPGDEIRVQTLERATLRYRVIATDVVHKSATRVMLGGRRRVLTLVTQYPFDADAPTGPMRYIVTARASGEEI